MVYKMPLDGSSGDRTHWPAGTDYRTSKMYDKLLLTLYTNYYGICIRDINRKEFTVFQSTFKANFFSFSSVLVSFSFIIIASFRKMYIFSKLYIPSLNENSNVQIQVAKLLGKLSSPDGHMLALPL